MGKIVDHQKRRRDILDKAIDLFSLAGYQNVTYQMIAARCGLQRTALYKYFPTKHAIFENGIKSITNGLAEHINTLISERRHLSYSDQILLILEDTLDIMNRHIPLLQTINEYLIGQRRQGYDVARLVHRYTILGRRTFINLVREGIAAGEFRPMNCTIMGDILYSLLESAALRIAISDTDMLPLLKKDCQLTVKNMKA